MLERLRTQIGTAGLVVAIVALVAALGGGAYAASSNGKATASAKAKQGKQGKQGKTGPAGPQGPAGPAGPAGAKGDAGAPGTNGINGTNGKDGEDGKDGEEGVEGSPWTAGGTLPPEATETGAWASPPANESGEAAVSISFPIPLAAPLGENNVVVVTEGQTPIPGSCDNGAAPPASATNPEADAGFLCFFIGDFPNESSTAEVLKIFPAGAQLSFSATPAGASVAGAIAYIAEAQKGEVGAGTWAVTGAE
jgi:Collagen triple helix repeat (20 copies)